MATSVDDELLRTRLTCFFFPCQPLASLTEFSAVATHLCELPLFGFSLPFPLLLPFFVPCSLFLLLFLLLSLLLTQPHSIGISQDSAALRSEVPVLILDKLDMRATRSVVRATTPAYDLKTNLNSVEFPLYFRSLQSFNVFPDTSTIRPDPPHLFRHAIRIKTTPSPDEVRGCGLASRCSRLQDAPSACQQVQRVLCFEGPPGRGRT